MEKRENETLTVQDIKQVLNISIDTMSKYLSIDQLNAAPKLNGAAPRARFADLPLPVFSNKRDNTA